QQNGKQLAGIGDIHKYVWRSRAKLETRFEGMKFIFCPRVKPGTARVHVRTVILSRDGHAARVLRPGCGLEKAYRAEMIRDSILSLRRLLHEPPCQGREPGL